MTDTLPRFTTDPLSDTIFEDKIVTNEEFFQVMEEWLSKTLPTPEVHIQTRLELKKLIAQMKQKPFIDGVTEWTAHEQRAFFEQVQREVQKTHSEIENAEAGHLASLRTRIQKLITHEIWREITDDGKKEYSLQDGKGNTIIPNMEKYKDFLDTSFLIAKETRIIPLDLHLTIWEKGTVWEAKEKLKKYQGKYNALVLINDDGTPIGVVKSELLQEYGENITMKEIPFIPDVFWHYTTSSEDVKNIMQQSGINILPIVDTTTHILIGILTTTTLDRKEIQYYSTTSLTKLNIDLNMGM